MAEKFLMFLRSRGIIWKRFRAPAERYTGTRLVDVGDYWTTTFVILTKTVITTVFLRIGVGKHSAIVHACAFFR